MQPDNTGRTIIIAGGSGYLGRHLSAWLAARGDRVVVLARRPAQGGANISQRPWDGASVGEWASALEGADAVINLAGRSVNCRYNARNRAEIYASRLRSTAAVGAAIARCRRPPPVWINASSATIYRHALDRPMDEASGEIGSGFSVDVCQRWEEELFRSATPHTRRVALRCAIVLGPGRGGPFAMLRNLVRLGLGGTQGPGSQMFSWVHIDDVARSIDWLLGCSELGGPVNCAAPNPVTNAELMRTLRATLGQPIGLPATRWMLEVGALALRTETELLLKSRWVLPGRLLASGFSFSHPQLGPALAAIVARGTATP